ncbi:MAG: IclR family transcriptional regulator [Sneathiellaceae bacterium]
MPNSSPPAPPRPAARRVKSIEVGFRLIRALEALDGYRPLKEIAATAGMRASKAYLYLASFVDEGLVHQDPQSGHYGLGPFATQIGLSAIRQLDVVGLARDELVPLRQATGCAAYVCVWGSRGPTIVVKVDGEYQGSMVVRVGYVLPLLRSSTGRVFLAWRSGSEADVVLAVDQLVSDPEDDPPDPGTLRQRMAEIVDNVQAQGYAFTDWDTVRAEKLGIRYPINAGFAALSAPIFDYSGALAASLTLLGPQRLVSERRPHYAAMVTDAAGRVSARMGYSGTGERAGPSAPGPAGRRAQPARAATVKAETGTKAAGKKGAARAPTRKTGSRRQAG